MRSRPPDVRRRTPVEDVVEYSSLLAKAPQREGLSKASHTREQLPPKGAQLLLSLLL